jgi:hypothetical protein
MVYIIGDSHVSIFSGVDTINNGEIHIQPEWNYCYTIKDGQFISLRPHNPFIKNLNGVIAVKFGSNTAYNLKNKINKFDEIISAYDITKNDKLLLCFGEIDIRAHLGFKSEEKGCELTEIIKECVDRYIDVLNELKEKNLAVGVFAPTASLPNELVYTIGRNYKNSQTRNKITTEFNDYLKIKCVENDFIFKDIHKKMLRDDYSSDPKYFKDNIHVSKHVLPFILEELNDII